MMKISALNEESSEESDEENNLPRITKEAQEQIALTEYNKALELLKQENVEDALCILKDLLETELLDQVEKPEVPDGRTRPMLSLKYCCYKNIGGIYAQLERYDEAIDYYWEAANLDDTDVMLWCRMGSLALKTASLEFACSAFKQGLKCNPNHWPCLDNIITAMFAVPDHMNCLLYISMALERDPSYVKGLAFREKIFKDIPFFEESYKLFNPDWALDPPLDTDYDRCLGDKLVGEAKEVADKWIEVCRPDFEFKPIPDISLKKPLEKFTWLELGESLIDIHKYITENNLNFISKVNLNVEREREDESGVNARVEEKLEEAENLPLDKELVDLSESMSIDIDCEIDMNDEKILKLDDQQVPDINLLAEMEVDVDDEAKSDPSSDVQIIEDEDPLKLDVPEIKSEVEEKIEDPGDFTETINISDDADVTSKAETSTGDVQKPRGELQKLHTIELNEKSSDKISDKTSRNDKSNEQTETKDEQQKVKKRRRSSLCFLQQWAWSSSSMRRSPRVRGSNRREPERDDVELEETMRRIFPSNLLPDTAKIIRDDPLKSMDDSMDTMDLYQLFTSRETTNTDGIKSSESSKSPSPLNSSENVKYFDSELEITEVQEFVNQHSGKSNLMIIIAKFTEILSSKWHQEWPKGLPDIYLQSYLFTREHIPHSSPFGDPEEDESILKHEAEMTLLFCELHTDKWLDNKPETVPSSTVDKFGTGIPSEELGYIIFASVREDLLNDDHSVFLLRVLWVKANLFMCQGDTEVALKTLELLTQDLEKLDSTKTSSVKLPNCKYYSRIALPIVQKRLTSIERGKRLGQVQRLYDEKKYSELSVILQETFKYAKQRNEVITALKLNVDRVKQLSMLLDCLWQLEQYENCFIWAEACLNEAWQVYINSTDEYERKKWSYSVLNCLEKLEICVESAGTTVLKYLDQKTTRLVQNLIQITCHQLDVPENSMEMPLETVIPWIILHHVLQHDEDKERAKSRQSQKSKHSDSHESDSEDEDKDIPAPLMILFTGHEFLGRHAWCCMNEAKLLLFTLKTIIPRMCGARLAQLREKIDKHLEQMFWCLYGHPNRTNKTKPKHLEDHQVPTIPLTWDVAQLLFEFYKPELIPEFDSPRPMSISADTQHLFKKISSLVPKEHDPSELVEEMTNYIVGENEKKPSVSKSLPYQVDSLYYLLADHLFKNNNFSSAIKYYTMDVVLHPTAFNSWAALAMSVGTVMGTFLNNCKPISDINKLLFQAKMAQCSFAQAVELKPGHSVMWIEYGNFVYMVHSFCSRLLKQESDTMSMEKFAILETRKEDTLEAADNCFHSANRIYLANADEELLQDERWLYHYMLAKIAEKRNEDPPVFLEHYERASELLYKNNAHYPKRISLKNANNSAVEALEVHYRIHASILKYLEQHEGKPLKKSLGQLFLKHLLECASGPFMQFPSKLNKNKRKEDVHEDKCLKNFEGATEVIPKIRTQEKRQNSVEEILIEKSELKKIDNKKRGRDAGPEEPSKRLKVGNISHLQLMQDVLSVIDELITKVCDISIQSEQKELKDSSDEIMVISSDESDKERQVGPVEKKDSVTSKLMPVNAQDMMDDLMKQMLEEQGVAVDEEESRKSEGKWLQHEDLQASENNTYTKEKDKEYKERHGEKKKTQVNAVKEDATMSRRGSQESTTTTLTTTTNETNNSSFSSSDESSSSDDSSDSDSSSVDSDSDSGDSEVEKKKSTAVEEKEEYLTEAEVSKIISYCLAGLEQCVLRFPGHYKSIYRLCHFYFNNKSVKDNSKCRDLLMGTFKCQYHPGTSIQGLFADRKSTNFFNGVWRIPTDEIDRPGSFPSHMSRCVTLLMQVLKETDDSRMLMELCIQLRKIPDADKKYVRDSEREQLSRQALTLSLQSLRTRLQLMGPPTPTDNTQLFRTDSRTHVLLDVYKIYQQVQKNFQGKEVQAFATLLVDTYKSYMGIKTAEGNLLEVAMRFCQQQNQANKIAAVHSHHPRPEAPMPLGLAPAANSAAPNQCNQSNQFNQLPNAPINQTPPVPTSPQAPQQRKPYKTPGTGRPRGRPPNINKHLQVMQSGGLMSQLNPKSSFGGYLGATGNQSLMNPFFMNPLIDQNMISAMLATGLGGNMMDPLSAVNYFTQMGIASNYQDIFRQYQNNLTSMGSLGGFANLSTPLSSSSGTMPTMSSINTSSSMPQTGMPGISGMSGLNSMGNLGSLTVQQLLNLQNSTASTTSAMMYNQSKPTTTSSSSKDHHSISITPVGAKKSKHIAVTDLSHVGKSMAPQKSLASPTQVSLLKPSALQPPKTTPPKQMSAPQIRVSKSLTEPQPAHNASLSLSPMKSASPSGINLPPVSHGGIQNSGLNIKPVSMGMQRGGTSLQHKLLLSKKQGQPLPKQNIQQNVQLNSLKKRSSSKSQVPGLPKDYTGNYQGRLGISGAGVGGSFIPSELSGISVSPVSQAMSSKIPPKPAFRKSSKSKAMDMTGGHQSGIPSGNTAETYSMLSQLQQHSHLEIIPQKGHSKNIEFGKNLPLSLSVVPKGTDGCRSGGSDAMAVYEVPRKSTSAGKKGDKNLKESVEIITLDD